MTAEVGTQILGTPVTLRTSARSSTADVSPIGDTDMQVAQVAAADHLDVRWSAPTVVDGEIVVHEPYWSPLDADEHGQFPTVLRGGPVHDPGEVEQIRARVERRRWSR